MLKTASGRQTGFQLATSQRLKSNKNDLDLFTIIKQALINSKKLAIKINPHLHIEPISFNNWLNLTFN